MQLSVQVNTQKINRAQDSNLFNAQFEMAKSGVDE